VPLEDSCKFLEIFFIVTATGLQLPYSEKVPAMVLTPQIITLTKMSIVLKLRKSVLD
jgi:hypothetical protein